MSNSSDADERTLREIYFPAFETAVKKAQPYTVMCSYNRINGTYASENPWLLTDVLRKEWGFEGYVMSDWGAVNNRVPGLIAGLDLEMPSSNGQNDALIVQAVKDGSLKEEILDQAVERILRVLFTAYDNRTAETLNLESDHETARHIAEESMVLLKNEQVLPLKSSEKVAFIGEFVKKPRFQGGGSSHINSFKIDNAWDSLPKDAQVVYAKGFPANGDLYDEALAAQAIQAASTSDKAVIFAGLPDSFESEGYDRTHMRLPDCQNRLIEEILKVQPNTIVVLHNGSPVELPWRLQVRGILEAYLGGQAGGAAVANILYGKVNPCGKLAETFPVKLSDNPSYLNFGGSEHVEYREGVFIGYRYYDTKEMEVAFPFGHGLSYTTFSYDNLQVSNLHPSDTDTLTVSVDVTNTGHMEGKEIVQLYVKDLTGSAIRPEKELKGFGKVSLLPGETKTITMELDKRSFAWYHTELKDWYAASGSYELLIGASSRDTRLKQQISLTSSQLPTFLVTPNTALGDLVNDPRTKDLAQELLQKYAASSQTNGSDASTEAISDEMIKAMTESMPIRALTSFGSFSREELQEYIHKFQELCK